MSGKTRKAEQRDNIMNKMKSDSNKTVPLTGSQVMQSFVVFKELQHKMHPEMSETDIENSHDSFLRAYEGSMNSKVTDSAGMYRYAYNLTNSTDSQSWNNGGNVYSGIYSVDRVRQMMENPAKSQELIRKLSNYLYPKVMELKNLQKYFANMLTLDNLILPVSDAYEVKKFKKLVTDIESFNVKKKFGLVLEYMLAEDVYYGYQTDDGEFAIWQRLPAKYCRIRGLDKFDTYTFDFNYQFFTDNPTQLPENYGQEFVDGFEIYKKNKSVKNWQKVNPKRGICFKFDESISYNLPFFASMYDDLLNLLEAKRIDMEDATTRNYKLLAQKIPMDTKNGKKDAYMINDVDAVDYHSNVRKNVPSNIGVVTTPMDITGVTLQNVNQNQQSITASQMENLMGTAGINGAVLGIGKNSGSVGAKQSQNADEAIMFKILRQFECFMNKKFYYKPTSEDGRANPKYEYKMIFLDITEANRNEVYERYLKAGQHGFGRFYVNASLGHSQSDLLFGSKLEYDLDFFQYMIPMESSYQQSGDDEAGAPTKDVKTASGDKTERNR